MLRDQLANLATRFDLKPELRKELEDMIQLALLDSFRATAIPIVNQGPPDNGNRPPLEAEVPAEDIFEDLGSIGHGGMADVRRVKDLALNRVMAMKVIHRPLLDDPSWISRFIEEAQATAQLQHPGIVPIHQIGQLADGRHYFTMPEIRGRTLREVIQRHFAGANDYTSRGLVSAFRHVCEAVAYAHARGVVHRDLKPANIMLGGYGEVFVLDWGIAKILGSLEDQPSPVVTARSSAAAHLTQFGIVAGTPSYMPPEQASGGVRDVDERADVYALGAILYELISGRPPFDGDNQDEILEQVRNEKPPPLSGPAELVEICERAMARDPEDRYPDAEPLAAELGSYLDGARQRETALHLVRQAEQMRSKAMSLGAQAVGLRVRAEATLAIIPATAPESEKAKAWSLLDRAAALDSEASRGEVEREHHLNAAFTHCPDLPEAHAALAELYHGRHEVAEPAGDVGEATRAEFLLRKHATALPDDHESRKRLLAYLSGDGALTLITEPAGAEVTLYRYELKNRRKVAVLVRVLGRTPLHAIPVPMGSYMCHIEAPGRADIGYPVDIARSDHWCAVGPGDDDINSLFLPRPGLLGADDCFMPAGWFQAGPNRQKVWVEDTIVKRASVTNAEYLVFLNALSSDRRLDEAIRHAPRERSGTTDRPGAMIYRLERGKFSLQPDSDGDLWHPNWPVLMVDWWAAQAFADWTANRTGRPWRLGTEAEWEKAARGVDGRLFPWGDAFDPSWACTLEGHVGAPLPRGVGDFGADVSPYGVVGLAGNAQDWCTDPGIEPESSAPRPIRGGSWGREHGPAFVRSALPPGSRDENTGFRLFFTPKRGR